MPYSMMLRMSSTFSSSMTSPLTLATSSIEAMVRLQLAQPVPSTLTFRVFPLWMGWLVGAGHSRSISS